MTLENFVLIWALQNSKKVLFVTAVVPAAGEIMAPQTKSKDEV